MNFIQKTRGSISVFLVIILVPVIVVCSVFVDASRIELAKALASSAGDLTLNTVLTQYDKALNESYGLLASSQNIDEFLGNAEGYFTACMVSQGVDTTEAKKYAGEISKMFNDEGEIVDFMKVDLGQTSAEVSPLEGADLANAALVKNEIVEFMKYRSPINNISDFIGKMSDVEEDVKDKPMEVELTNKKNQYYEAENKLLQKALDVYLLILEYNEYKITSQYITEIETYLNGCEETYRGFHTKHIKDWNNTGGDLGQKVFPSIATQVKTDPASNSTFTEENTASEDSLKAAITRCSNYKTAYDTAKADLQEKINNAPIDVNFKEADYGIQYWIQTAEAISKGDVYNKFIKAANDLFRSGSNLKQTYDCRITYREVTEDVPKEVTSVDKEGNIEKKTVIESVTTRIEVTISDETQSNYDAAMSACSGAKSELSGLAVYKISAKLEEISKSAVAGKVTDRGTANNQIAAVAAKLQEYYDHLKKGSKKMLEIMDGLNEMKKLAQIYGAKFEAWEGYANESDGKSPKNTMVDDDLEEIKKIKESTGGGDGEFEKMDRFINEEQVGLMLNRCNAINALFGSFTEGMDKLQYNGTSIRKIKKYDTFSDVASIDQSRITIVNQELETYIQTTWAIPIFTKPAPGEIHKVTIHNNPEFKKKPPDLYTWMKDVKFRDYEKEKHDDGKKQFEDLKKQMDEEEKKKEEENKALKNRNSKEEIKGKENLPSKGTGSSAKSGKAKGKDSGKKLENASSDTKELTDNTQFDIMLAFESLRDNLYVTDYIMSMLSYDTYELEGKYEMLRKGHSKDDIYEVTGGKINPGNAASLYAAQDENWKNESTIFTENKSLTNKMINLDNNFSYGNEAEYILYGNKILNNKLASYATIYSLRYAINIAPVFQKYWNKSRLVREIAVVISTATNGVIPIPLVKMIICLGITAAEAAVDINYLRVGIPVLFVKKVDDLFLVLEESISEVSTKISGFKENKELAAIKQRPCFNYSDYLRMFLLIATSTNGESIYLRVADVIQCNMQKQPNYSSFLLSNSKVYFELEADVKVSPLTLGLPFARQEGANILDTSSWNSFTFNGIRGY